VTNKLTARTLPNGVVTTSQYDGLNRLTRLTHAKGANTLADFQYQVNTVNDITQMTDGAGSNNYTYDSLDRLTAATHPNQTNESYTYDDVGNRTASHQGASYSYQPFNRLVGANGSSFSYDANGNLISKSDAAGNWIYTWDYENRLKQAALSSGVTVNYAYDALGRRVERSSSSGSVKKFVNDGVDVVRDLNTDLTVAADYLNGLGLDDKLRQISSGTAAYYLLDHLGSTRALTDNSGNISASFSYDSFGNVSGGPAPTGYGYTGRELDADTGLMYYRARWYDPQQGRFLSMDPLGFSGGDVNLYAYVLNNPANFRDPTGTQRADRDRPGDIEWARGLKKQIDSMPTSPVKKSLCCNKTWTDCYAQCIENNRLDSLLPLLGSALPKRLLPPFRVVTPTQPLTTIPSTVAHYTPNARLAGGLRGAGRLASRVATPLVVFEGFYDWGLLGSCAELCHRDPCN
jgi:RHS repeat-associated protein